MHIGFVPEIFAKLPAGKRLAVRNIVRSPLIVLVSEHHPWREGRCGCAIWRMRLSLHILMYGSDAQRVWTREICRSIGFMPQFGSAASNAENLVSMVAAGEGVALIPKIAERTGTPGCAALPLTDKACITTSAPFTMRNFPSGLRDTFLGIVEGDQKGGDSGGR